MKAILDREALQIAYAADDGSNTRPILEHVKIGNSEILAADGFIIARRQIKTSPIKGKEILVSAQDLIRASGIIKGDVIIQTIDDKTAVLKDEANTITIKTQLLEGNYPSTKAVIPKTERKAYVALQKRLLTQILKIAESTQGIVLQFKIREPHQPIEVIAGETIIYAMPMYHPEDNK